MVNGPTYMTKLSRNVQTVPTHFAMMWSGWAWTQLNSLSVDCQVASGNQAAHPLSSSERTEKTVALF